MVNIRSIVVTLLTVVLVGRISAQTQPEEAVVSGEIDTLAAPDTLVAPTNALDTEPTDKVGWQEVMASFTASLLRADMFDGDNEYTHWQDMLVYGVEYRYSFVENLTIGGRVTMATFPYELGHASFEPEPPDNNLVNLSVLVHLRTSSYRHRSSLILFGGFTMTHFTFQRTTLVRNVSSSGFDRTTLYPVPKITRWVRGIPFGIGWESATFNNGAGRLRIFIDYIIHQGRGTVALVSYVPSLGFGVSW